MGEVDLTTTARVTFTIEMEVDVPGYTKEKSIEMISRFAKDTAATSVNKILKQASQVKEVNRAGIVGSPKVKLLVVEGA